MNRKLSRRLFRRYHEFFGLGKPPPWYLVLWQKVRKFLESRNSRLSNQIVRRLSQESEQKSKFIHNLMVFGFECGDGWYNLLNTLCRDIKKINKDPNFIVSQVKEKYGTLRFYYYGGSDKIGDLIDKAEGESAKICETCGTRRDVKRRNDGWVTTLCLVCYEKWKEPSPWPRYKK